MTNAQDTEPLAEPGFTKWLRERLRQTINALDSGEMKSYSNETAKTVLHARLEARRSKLNLRPGGKGAASVVT